MRLEMLAEAVEVLDGHVNGILDQPDFGEDMVVLAGRVRRSLEGMHDLLELYQWVDGPSVSTSGVTPLMSP